MFYFSTKFASPSFSLTPKDEISVVRKGKPCGSKYVTPTKHSGIWKAAFTLLIKSLISGVAILLTNDSVVKLFGFEGGIGRQQKVQTFQ